MRQKIITALGLVILFSVLFSVQVSQIVNAQVMPAVTGPITVPITSPITGPSSMFTISGKVTYQIVGFLLHGAQRFMSAPGVIVKAFDIFNHHSTQTTTDANGNYTLNPGQSGLYQVTVSGGRTSLYLPALQFVNDNNPNGKNNVNFQGLIFSF